MTESNNNKNNTNNKYGREIDYEKLCSGHRVQKNQADRRHRKINMWLTRTRRLLRFLIIVFLCWLFVKIINCHYWYMTKTAFDSVNNPSLEILNNKIVPSYNILAALRKEHVPNVPIYLYRTDSIKENILKIDPIQDVFIRRFWFPARLQIIVQERTPLITIAPSETVPPIAFFTKDGKLIGRDYLPLNPSIKTIKVLTYGIRGDDYRKWSLERIKQLEKIANSIESSTKVNLDYIDLRIPNDTYISIDGIKIRLGSLDETCYERIDRIPSILPQVNALDKKFKYIDLRWKESNFIKLEE